MTTHRLFNDAHVVWQSGNGEDVPNEAVAVCIDNGGTMLLRQGDNELVLDVRTVPELCQLMKRLAAAELKKLEVDQ